MSASAKPNLPDATPGRLLEAAGQVFADKGFEGATVREICQRAGVNIAAVNYYFRDKERLYIEAVKSACHGQAEQVPAWPEGTPGSVKLRDFIQTMVRRMVDGQPSQWQRQLFLREMAQPTAACAELVREVIRPMAEVLSGILAELMPGVPEDKRWLIGFSIVGQCLFYRLARPIVTMLVGEKEHRRYDATLLAEHITQFSLAALGLSKTQRAPAKRASKTRNASRAAE
jgi:TetR/AcrR family transcriptional regulator, regulator of cefoperazone and chloramphenicol sensitivity